MAVEAVCSCRPAGVIPTVVFLPAGWVPVDVLALSLGYGNKGRDEHGRAGARAAASAHQPPSSEPSHPAYRPSPITKRP